ncbi:MAG: hypothetical protein Q9174_000715 [Haloplaca sp. 1 TL-2023]
MLFEFHKQQNCKKAGSVHAVYLVSGLLAEGRSAVSTQNLQTDGEDAHMQSSPFLSSSIPQKDDTESQSTANLHILSDCNRKTVANDSSEDPLTVGRQYGIIQNSRVKRRTGARPVTAAPTTKDNGRSLGFKNSSPAVKAETPKAQVKSDSPAELKNVKGSQQRPSSQEEPKPKEQTRRQSTQEKKGLTKPPGLKKEQSDIFKSFSKPQPKVSRTNTDNSIEAASTPTTFQFVGQELITLKKRAAAPAEKSPGQDDVHMTNSSEDEEAEDFPPSNQQAVEPGRPTRSEHDDPLDRPDKSSSDKSQEQLALDEIPQKQAEPTVERPSQATGGRRRVKKKVTKKKTVKDEEGYLVTREVAAWESYSEEEPAPKEATPISTASSVARGKKTSEKPGQGNIMSFFGKK